MSYNRIDLATIASMQQSLQALQRRQTMPLSAELIGEGYAARTSSRDSRLFFIWKEIIRQNGQFFNFVYEIGFSVAALNRQIMQFTVSGLYFFDIALVFLRNPPAEVTIAVVDTRKAGTSTLETLAQHTFSNAESINAQFTVYIEAGSRIAIWFQTSDILSPVRVQGVADAPALRIVCLSQAYSTMISDATIVRGITAFGISIANTTFTALSLQLTTCPFIPSYDTTNIPPLIGSQTLIDSFGSNALGGWDSANPSQLLFPVAGVYYVTALVVFQGNTGLGAFARWLIIRNQNNIVIAAKTIDSYVSTAGVLPAAQKPISVSCLVKAGWGLQYCTAEVYQNTGTNQNIIGDGFDTSSTPPPFYSLSAIYLGE